MGSLGTSELVIIGLIVLLLFGAKRLPAIARGIASIPAAFMRGKKQDPNEPG